MATLIERVQEALSEADLSPRAASLAANLSARFITDLIDGSKRSISIENAKALAPILNRTPEWLAFERGPKRPGEEKGAEIVDIWDRIPLSDRGSARRMLEGLAEPKRIKFEGEGE
ncbi:MAG: hypothetical protein AAFQ22_13195 [Pseudomonadota bacterium]